MEANFPDGALPRTQSNQIVQRKAGAESSNRPAIRPGRAVLHLANSIIGKANDEPADIRWADRFDPSEGVLDRMLWIAVGAVKTM